MRRSFGAYADDIFSSEYLEAQWAFDLTFWIALLFWLDPSKFFGIGNNNVKVFVKGKKSSYKHTVVVYCTTNSVVNPLPKFRLGRHIFFD